ncbi:putative EH-domain containing 4 [Monocercomonoides exilis]|uniref:putative EH-domain containing 4 n=1 Tax=Monocercomonoides exilis TaxID=2049356 RepID=UPI00355A31F1|nr:putative EH-domain containing 4 [Monocercomonoides exilis]|eukprot:MONOS_2828.1-p1 / transcript=MONOS_2828.1 / gene=MONOS_2828 / organism=Monocercomonoides_exilis_PA203 / gene_product=EH-domain containing 4 / transcript_product=EH-domain containing 4 / location=Mono_scaffold00061:20458-23279(-) / protein_length=725 / sequence_SO=supercontig / SO=protein_coding / is_pseudo=false
MSGPVTLSEKIDAHNDVVEGLKRLYREKIVPLEESCQFHMFHSHPLRDSDFDANPMVMLIGQYSVGKTSFIEYLLGRSYPGMMIGPEPTTDKFVAVYYGEEDNIIPGNTASMHSSFPFQQLDRFGSAFLTRFNVSTCNSDFLKSITLIDTPGVLSGERERVGRAYNFRSVVEWFAVRCDLILLLFDANKLDISDEFRDVINGLRGNEDKIRVILNKADTLSTQNLMRVYGALLWSLSRVFMTPENVRVYIGSFWNQPLKTVELENLFHREMDDLLKELGGLPRVAAQRKVNEVVKRTKLSRAIAALTTYLKEEMTFFGKEKKKAELIANLPSIYTRLSLQYGFSIGDFPPVDAMRMRLQHLDFDKFRKIPIKMFEAVNQALTETLPQHLQLLQPSVADSYINPFELEAKYGEIWQVTPKEAEKYKKLFLTTGGVNLSHCYVTFGEGGQQNDASAASHPPSANKHDPLWDLFLTGEQLKPVFAKSGVDSRFLRELWRLADTDKDEKLSFDEFVIAMHLLKMAKQTNGQLPLSLPLEFVQRVRKEYGLKSRFEEQEKERERKREVKRAELLEKEKERERERAFVSQSLTVSSSSPSKADQPSSSSSTPSSLSSTAAPSPSPSPPQRPPPNPYPPMQSSSAIASSPSSPSPSLPSHTPPSSSNANASNWLFKSESAPISSHPPPPPHMPPASSPLYSLPPPPPTQPAQPHTSLPPPPPLADSGVAARR